MTIKIWAFNKDSFLNETTERNCALLLPLSLLVKHSFKPWLLITRRIACITFCSQ